MKLEIEEFAKKLVEYVRDESIIACENELKRDALSPRSKRWWKKINEGKVELFAREIIPDVVDETIFCLLNSLDHGLIELDYISSSENRIDLMNEGQGEMAGWFLGGRDGWRKKYSQQRINDDFSNISLDFLDDKP